MEAILAQVKQTVAKISGIDPQEITDETTFDALELDSLSRIEVLVELERHYKLDIPEDQFTEEDLVAQIQSVRQAADLVFRYLADES
jgi:acyl carrier protein